MIFNKGCAVRTYNIVLFGIVLPFFLKKKEVRNVHIVKHDVFTICKLLYFFLELYLGQAPVF